MTAFWDISVLMTETKRTSETSVYYERVLRSVSEHSHLHTRRREKLKAHMFLTHPDVLCEDAALLLHGAQ
jgi:hypothetical protein